MKGFLACVVHLWCSELELSCVPQVCCTIRCAPLLYTASPREVCLVWMAPQNRYSFNDYCDFSEIHFGEIWQVVCMNIFTHWRFLWAAATTSFKTGLQFGDNFSCIHSDLVRYSFGLWYLTQWVGQFCVYFTKGYDTKKTIFFRLIGGIISSGGWCEWVKGKQNSNPIYQQKTLTNLKLQSSIAW